MHIDDMDAEQRGQVATAARCMALGSILTILHPVHWLAGVLGFLLLALYAIRMRPLRPGFDRVQLFASLCALVCLVLSSTVAAALVCFALPVLETLLVYAVWQAFGRMCADGNRLGRAALCATLLYTALMLSSTLLGLSIFGGLQMPIYLIAQAMALAFHALGGALLAVFLLIKRRKIKEVTP
ncbi:hypothetical protein [Intestinibacillus sp. Marseille-P6563]|uniref:hypothetical protein n=1 Tax=Intestinibacillus sp. Marseille-P6563 TaxID=2364792 RepID=UPI000F04B826|nr:hypothetical protein [Intestinibacillus sp. Marseille-P6563]